MSPHLSFSVALKKVILPGFIFISSVSIAGTLCRKMALRPDIFKSAGLTNCSKATIDETGLPGSPKAGLPAITPNASGFPGFSATFQNFIVEPSSPRTSLTRS